jgi:hypothetical protein
MLMVSLGLSGFECDLIRKGLSESAHSTRLSITISCSMEPRMLQKTTGQLGWQFYPNLCGGAKPVSRRKVAMVERSAIPSTRAGRKWRWNAMIADKVMAS